MLTGISLISVIIIITIIVSGGICHAVNLIDGLSICWAIYAAVFKAIIALNVNDMAVFRLLLLLIIGASIGILFGIFR